MPENSLSCKMDRGRRYFKTEKEKVKERGKAAVNQTSGVGNEWMPKAVCSLLGSIQIPGIHKGLTPFLFLF